VNRRSASALCILVLLSPALSAQSIANEVNEKLPDWLQLGGLFRTRFEGFLDRAFTPDENDVHLLNRLRLNINVRARTG
jgi:hypothetical protein